MQIVGRITEARHWLSFKWYSSGVAFVRAPAVHASVGVAMLQTSPAAAGMFASYGFALRCRRRIAEAKRSFLRHVGIAGAR